MDVAGITLPVEVRSARMASATYLVRAARAAPMIPPGLTLATTVPHRALCAVGFVDYLDSDLGSYHEILLAFIVTGPDGGRPGAYIHRLPVDQTFTMEAGRRLWGFPKWLTTSSVEFDGRGHAACVLEDGGHHAMTLSIGRGVPLPGRTMTMDAWTWGDGVLRRTPWTMRLGAVRGRPGGATLVPGHGSVLADDLRALGLGRAVLSSTAGEVSASFGAADVVAPAASPAQVGG